jgi:hypothetical protein
VGKIEKKVGRMNERKEGKKGRREGRTKWDKMQKGDHPSNHEKLKMFFSMKSPAEAEGRNQW